ncbi:hypothetical protein OESDEN_02851 [Oesophagostomum dentatum]|uniref:Uncharacterized protein n=1 Tax=Oesophagostomum dentatum TaxID=61180 RepID=A0A0B1TI30_OESDE|nr:hypothetical protein OESDEN_02851 [Oesophagostomum dentatum]
MDNTSPTVSFATKSGELVVKKRDNNFVEMDFPQYGIATIRFVGAPNPMAEFFSEFDAPSHLSDLIDSFIPSSVKVEGVAYASEARNLIVVIDRQTTNFELSEIYTAKRSKKFKTLRSVVDFVGGVTITLAPVNAKNQVFSRFFDEKNDGDGDSLQEV